MKILLITPCGKEEGVIQKHIDSVVTIDGFDILFIVDDFTNEETNKILRDNSTKNKRIKILSIKNNTGLAACYLEGYKWFSKSDYDQVIEMDVDSHKCEDLKLFMEKIKEGNKIIFGNRNLGNNNSSIKRRAISRMGTMFAKILLGLNLDDATTGFQSFSKEVVRSLDFDKFISTSFLIQTEMKYRVLNIPCKEALEECQGLVSKISCYKFFKFKNGPRYEYSEIPIRYENSKTSLNYKMIFSSFIEFLLIVLENRF